MPDAFTDGLFMNSPFVGDNFEGKAAQEFDFGNILNSTAYSHKMLFLKLHGVSIKVKRLAKQKPQINNTHHGSSLQKLASVKMKRNT